MKTTIKVVAGVVAFLVVGFLFNLKRNGAKIEDMLVNASVEINKGLPKMLDDETRLDNTVPGPGKKLSYTYTLVKHEKSELDLPKLEAALRPDMISNYKTNSQMQTFRDYEVELHYRYNDKSGQYLFETVVSPKDF